MNTLIPEEVNERLALKLWKFSHMGHRGGHVEKVPFYLIEEDYAAPAPNFYHNLNEHGVIVEKLRETYYVTIECLFYSDSVECNLRLVPLSLLTDNKDQQTKGPTEAAARSLACLKALEG